MVKINNIKNYKVSDNNDLILDINLKIEIFALIFNSYLVLTYLNIFGLI
jgi:hypothetical protein